MSNLDYTQDSLVYPKANLETVVLDFRDINSALQRISDITTANPDTAPELMSTFNDAYSHLSKHLAYIRLEHDKACSKLSQRESEIILDESTELLSKRGIKPTDTLRKALIPIDSKYNLILDNVQMLKAIVKLVEGQLKSLDMAYMSVKKIFPSKFESLKLNHNPHEIETLEVGNNHFKVGKVNYGE